MNFSALYEKYDSMAQPAYTVKVGNQVLNVGRDLRLLRAECTLTCRREAGSLYLEAALDPEGENGKAWIKALQVGAVCTFSVGYGSSQTQVFKGFLYDVVWQDPLDQGAMGLEALFLDVRGWLMTTSHADGGSTRKLSQMIQGILKQSGCTQLADKRTVGTVPEAWDLPTLRMGESDYAVLCRAADFLCWEFCVYAGELTFGPARKNTSPTVVFEGSQGLLQCRRRCTLEEQCGAVAVSGADDQGGRIYARRARSKDSGFGTAHMGDFLSGDLLQPEPTVRTMAQATYLAKARMEDRQHRAGGVSGSCLGLPEVRPGRFIQFQGLSQAVNGSYYVHTVRHMLDLNGYETFFEAEG